MPSVLVTAPTEEPVSLAEAKLHLRVDYSNDDVLIGALITAARQHAENDTRRALVTQTWRQVLDQFPAPGVNIGSANWYGPQWGNTPGPLTTLRADGRTGFEIYLDHSPVVSVDSLQYIDQDGVTQTLASSAYKLDSVTAPARLVPAYGTTWPTTRNEINAVSVTYTCGFGAAAAVPETIKRWMLLRIGALYENREEVATGRGVTLTPMPFVDSLLTPYRVLGF